MNKNEVELKWLVRDVHSETFWEKQQPNFGEVGGEGGGVGHSIYDKPLI